MASERRLRWWGLLLVALTALLWTGAWAAENGPELIVNGSFEKGPEAAGDGDVRLDPGSTAIEGWTVINGSIDSVGSSWLCSDGTRCLDLEGEAAFGSRP